MKSPRGTKLLWLFLGLPFGELRGLLLGVRPLLLPNTGDISSEELREDDGVVAIVSGVELTLPLLDFFFTGVL